MGAMQKIVTSLLIDGVKMTTIYPFNTLLINLIELVAEQDGQISSLEYKLDQHMIHPFKVGKQLLEEARFAASQEEKQRMIKEAMRAFLDVTDLDLPGYYLLPIQACLNVGLCYELLSERENSIRWYKKAFDQLSKAYPREYEFSFRYEKDLQNYENAKAIYQKKVDDYSMEKTAYELQMNKYKGQMDRYQKSLEELSYLSDNAKTQIRTYIVSELEAKEKAAWSGSGSRTRYLNNRLDPKITPGYDYKLPRYQTNRFTPSSNQFGNTTNPNRPLYMRRNDINQPASVSLWGIQTQANTIAQLYRILGISRDVQKDMPYLEEMMNKPEVGQTNYLTSRSLGEISARSSMERLRKTNSTPEIIQIMRKILKNNPNLLHLIQPPASPTSGLKAPRQPEEPTTPETLRFLETQDDQNDEGVFSKLIGKFIKSEEKFNREVFYLASDLSKLLSARR